MRCFSKVLAVSWCVFFAFLLAAPTAHSADSGRNDLSVVASPGVDNSARSVAASPSPQEMSAERYGDLPLSFEANQGQTDRRARFVSRGTGYSFFLTQTGAVLSFSRSANAAPTVLRMELAGASTETHIEGLQELRGKSNYFFGNDPRQWRTGVPAYSRVAYENLYPGIDLVYYGNQRQLEYDFVVAPGADPGKIRLTISGAEQLTVDALGNLVLREASGDVQLLAPKVYQQSGAQKREIAGQWTLVEPNVAGFRLGTYDRNQALVIDPVLTYSSFLGGSQQNALNRIAIDAAGNAYVAGYTASGDFPAAPTPKAMTFGNGAPSRGAFVAKIDPSGSTLLYATYLSGSVDEEATGLAVDKSGNVYLAGTTHSPDFPTQNAFQSTCNTHVKAGTCSSAFLTKIGPDGNSLVFSTYLGGSGGESARGLALDAAGNAYLAGVTSSLDFPVTAGTAQAKCGGACQQNAFVAKFDASGDSLAYATYLGGSGIDDSADLAVDASGNAYLTGRTTSPDFPLATPFQKVCALDVTSTTGACIGTAFVTKIKSDGSAFAYSTYLGGSMGSQASGIALDVLGNAYVTGSTQSADFPVLKAFQKSCGLDPTSHSCSVDAFVTKFTPSGESLVYSTYLGGSGHDEASGIVLDSAGNAHIIGSTQSTDFPTVASVQSQLKGTSDAFVARFNAAGNSLSFATYHGGSATESGSGIALDAKGNVYVAGLTTSADFPTSHAFQSSCAGTCASAFVTKMTALPQVTAPPSISKNFGAATIPLNGTTSLSFTITNPNAATTLTGIGFTDTLPAGLVISTPNGLTGTCGGGTITATSGTTSISLSGATLAGAASCTFSVNNDGITAGTQNNTTSAVTSVEGGNGNTASASIDVVAPPAIAKVFNPTSIAQNATTALTFTITNPAGNVDALTGVAFTDTLPTGLTVASASATVCGGTLTTTAPTGISLVGATIAVSGQCQFSITTNGATAGAYTNTTGAVSSTNGGTGNTATANLTVVAPPSIAKTFNPTTIAVNATTSLTFTITNPAPNTVPLTGVAFTDTIPTGLTVTSATSTVCGGTLTDTAPTGISLSGATIAASGQCQFSVTVTGASAGSYTNTTGAVTSTNGGTGNTATANLTVTGPPSIAKAFNPNSIALNATTSLTFTITNPSTTVTLTGVAFTDIIPTGLTVTSSTTTVCGGTLNNTAPTSIALTGATIAASGQCQFSVTVTGATAGSFTNTTGAVTSTNGGTGNTASANVSVVAPPSIAKAFNPTAIALGATTSLTFTITNPAANTVALAGVGFTDTLPTGLTVASSTATVCGGTLTTTNPTGISLAGATVAASGSCQFSVTVTGATAGTYTNTTGAVTSTNGGTGNTATANLKVNAPATITKAFGAASVVLNNSTSLTLTITNPNTTQGLTGVAFTDSLPSGLVVASTPGVTNTCNGTVTAAAGSGTVSLAAGTLATSASCAIGVNVTGTSAGTKNNTTSGVSSNEGGTGNPSNTATLTVQDFSWAISSSAATVIQGQSTSSTTSPVATAAPISGFNQNVAVSCTVAPATATITCSPSVNPIPGGSGSSTVTINTTGATLVGIYTVTITGTDNTPTVPVSHTQPFTLTVECTWTVSPASQTVNADATSGGKYSVNLALTGGSQCPWSATSSSFINLVASSGTTGSGGSVVSFDVASYYGAADAAPRNGTINFDFTNGTNGSGFTQPTGSSSVTQNEVVMSPIASPPPPLIVHVNTGTIAAGQIVLSASASNTANPNAIWSVSAGTCNGPCGTFNPPVGTSTTYIAPANIAANPSPHTSAMDTVSAASQADSTKVSPSAPQVQILNDQPLCAGPAAVMPDPLHSAVNPATGQVDPINLPVAIKVQHICTDNLHNENDLQSASVSWGDGTAAASTTFSTTGVASGTINPNGTDATFSHAYAATNFGSPYSITANPSDTSNATALASNIAPANVTIDYVASSLSALVVEATHSNSQDLPATSMTVTFASNPCATATNTNLFTISGVVKSDGTTDPANFGITCSVALNASNTAYTLTVNTTAASAAPAMRHATSKFVGSLVLLSLGVPGLVLLGLGVSAFGSKRGKRVRRLLCLFGILLILAALILLPACGGGIHAQLISSSGNTNAVYFLALTGIDGSGNQQTFIVPVTVTPPE